MILVSPQITLKLLFIATFILRWEFHLAARVDLTSSLLISQNNSSHHPQKFQDITLRRKHGTLGSGTKTKYDTLENELKHLTLSYLKNRNTTTGLDKSSNDPISMFPFHKAMEGLEYLKRITRLNKRIGPMNDGPSSTYFDSRVMEWSACSATCGIGIAFRLRPCKKKDIKKNGCHNYMVEYKTCNIQACTKPLIDFRYLQCRSFDPIPYRGQYFSWTPFDNKENPCTLTCLAQGYDFVVVFSPKVLDGTKCRNGSDNVCINGRCRAVGCDKKLGSKVNYDSCGVCGGNNSCSKSGYVWEETNFTACSVKCGGGYQMTSSYCRTTAAELKTGGGNSTVESSTKIVPNYYCEPHARPAPKIKTCANFPCPAKWITGEWSKCPETCGFTKQTREIFCARESSVNNNKTRTRVDPGLCQESKPLSEKQCPVKKCAYWKAGKWSKCSVTCGYGVRVLDLKCIGSDGAPSMECPEGEKPKHIERCNTKTPCLPIHESEEMQSNRPVVDFNDIGYHQQDSGVNFYKAVDSKESSQAEDTPNDLNFGNEVDPTKDFESDRYGEPKSMPDGSMGDKSLDKISRQGLKAKFFEEETGPGEYNSQNTGRLYGLNPNNYRSGNVDAVTELLSNPPPILPPLSDSSNLLYMFRPDFRYVVSDWSKCSKPCKPGNSFKSRSVKCKVYYPYTQIMVEVPDDQCRSVFKPPNEEKCQYKVCKLEENEEKNQEQNDGKSKTIDLDNGGTNKVHNEDEVDKVYSWKYRGFSDCSEKCLGGIQKSLILCVKENDNVVGNDAHCNSNRRPPAFERTCNEHPCAPKWEISGWSDCSHPCGKGMRVRSVRCVHQTKKGPENVYIVPPDMCPTPRPESRESCNVVDCPPFWAVGNWTDCVKSCDTGFRRRPIYCQQITAQGYVAYLKDERPCITASSAAKPAYYESCNAPLDERERFYCDQLKYRQPQYTTTAKSSARFNYYRSPLPLIADRSINDREVNDDSQASSNLVSNNQANDVMNPNEPSTKIMGPYKLGQHTEEERRNLVMNDATATVTSFSTTTTATDKQAKDVKTAKMMVSLKSPKSHLKVPKGTFLKMRCKPNTDRNQTKDVVWFKEDKNLTAKWEKHLRSLTRGVQLYHPRVSISPTGVLKFKPIQVKDSGRYICMHGGRGEGHTKVAIVDVIPQTNFYWRRKGMMNVTESIDLTRNGLLKTKTYAKLINGLEEPSYEPNINVHSINNDYSLNSIPNYIGNHEANNRESKILNRLEEYMSTTYEEIVNKSPTLVTNPTINLSHSSIPPDIGTINNNQLNSDGYRSLHRDASDFRFEDAEEMVVDKDESYSDLSNLLFGRTRQSNQEEGPVNRNATNLERGAEKLAQLEILPEYLAGTHSKVLDIARVVSSIKRPPYLETAIKTNKLFVADNDAAITGNSINEATDHEERGLQFRSLPAHLFYWQSYGWTKCSQPCGKNGIQIQVNLCHLRIIPSLPTPATFTTNNRPGMAADVRNVRHLPRKRDEEIHYKIVDDVYCDKSGIPRPPKFRRCGMDDCPSWNSGPWQTCKESSCENLNVAVQERKVYCAYLNGTYASRWAYDTTGCMMAHRPAMRRECYNELCKSQWIVSQWGQCSKPCGSGIQTRVLHCVWYNTTNSAGSHCFDLARPTTIRPCQNNVPCPSYIQPRSAKHVQQPNYSNLQEPSIGSERSNNGGNCRDQNHYCQMVKKMNLCDKTDYRYRCCESCSSNNDDPDNSLLRFKQAVAA